jgi:hypothetical protein
MSKLNKNIIIKYVLPIVVTISCAIIFATCGFFISARNINLLIARKW